MAPDAFRTLPLTDLGPDPDRFSFSWPPPRERAGLAERIARQGLLRPLWVLREGGRWVVAAGTRRLAALASLGWERVPVRVLEDVGPRGLWDRLLTDHLDHRSLNPVEAGLYLERRMAATGEDPEDLAGGVLPLLGLAPRAGAAQDPLWLSGLPGDLRDAVVEGRVPVAAARVLRDVPRDEALAVLRWLQAWRLGVNRFSELARWALESAWREGLAAGDWLEREGLASWTGDPASLRAEVRRRRYPAVARHEEAFARAVRGLGLPPQARVEAPPGFEGGWLECKVRFRSLEELARVLDELRGHVGAGRWDGLGELLG